MVVIVIDPKLGIVDGNVRGKPSGEKCPHLLGDKPGNYSCAVHNYDWYSQTPCAEFTQIERSKDDMCRLGIGIMGDLE